MFHIKQLSIFDDRYIYIDDLMSCMYWTYHIYNMNRNNSLNSLFSLWLMSIEHIFGFIFSKLHIIRAISTEMIVICNQNCFARNSMHSKGRLLLIQLKALITRTEKKTTELQDIIQWIFINVL